MKTMEFLEKEAGQGWDYVKSQYYLDYFARKDTKTVPLPSNPKDAVESNLFSMAHAKWGNDVPTYYIDYGIETYRLKKLLERNTVKASGDFFDASSYESSCTVALLESFSVNPDNIEDISQVIARNILAPDERVMEVPHIAQVIHWIQEEVEKDLSVGFKEVYEKFLKSFPEYREFEPQRSKNLSSGSRKGEIEEEDDQDDQFDPLESDNYNPMGCESEYSCKIGKMPEKDKRHPSGEMEIYHAPLEIKKNSRMGKRWKSTDEGVFIRNHHRLFTDGKVFAHKAKHFGGAVLIDTSGSMALSHSDLLQIIEMSPAIRIALYSGHQTKGTLRIVANKGMIASKEEISRNFGSGNIIDVPALRWLATQKGLKVWISDGQVTGRMDSSATNLSIEANWIRKKAKIIRRPDIHRGIEFLQKFIKH